MVESGAAERCYCGKELRAVPVYVHEGDGAAWFQRLEGTDEIERAATLQAMPSQGYEAAVIHRGNHIPDPRSPTEPPP